MSNKRASYELADFKADTRPDHLGEATALVSVFGNVDLMGDRVVKGAFAKSLAQWGESGDPIPVYWSHDWGNPKSNIGEVTAAQETDQGLQVDMKFDIHDNENAAYVFKLLRTRRVKEFSFAYQIEGERKGKDGANELTDLRILEVGPTFKGANPETELLATKDTGIFDSVNSQVGTVVLDAQPIFQRADGTWSTKAGAEMSAANRGRIKNAHDTIMGVLGDLRALAGMEPPKSYAVQEFLEEMDAKTEADALAAEITQFDGPPLLKSAEPDTHSEDEAPPTAKSDEPEESESLPTPQKAAWPDDDLLALQLRIAEMRQP